MMAIQGSRSGFEDFMPQTFSSMLDRFFNDSVNNRERLNRFSPLVDICETDQSYQIEATLPGLAKEDIQLDFHEGQLTISGERTLQKEQKEKKYHLVENHYGTFSRSFRLPDTIDPEKIEAVFENGILRVTVPKDERKTARHRIQVRDGAAQPVQLEESSGTGNQNPVKAAAPKKKQPSLAHENGTH
ncbi:Hsp20/alpha crystallin family protein [Rufibacter ruber]|uniref:Hsp20/alpha crystallin family protein n=1 Tax=Rufibacter ruber TaxID=1783499 RepID=UPI00083353E6|nr:Hsp20/alpha crystallin family protein [Rufibacter ruber]